MTNSQQQSQVSIKEAVGKAAANLIEDGMVVGLGTGTTAACFIRALSERCKAGLNIRGIATSQHSKQQAEELGIPVMDFETVTQLDITVDGADEIDAQKRMIKGGGGALLREKIVASASREMIVVVDESKLVTKFHKMPLPVEIIPFGHQATMQKIKDLGFHGTLRTSPNKHLYLTDNHNYIVDIDWNAPVEKPEEIHRILRDIVGVVDTGFFFNLAGRVIVGYRDGRVKILP